MLHGTIVSISRGRWENISSSEYFRFITFSSILYKLLDVIVMTTEKDNLCISNLQFSYRPSASTTLCKNMNKNKNNFILHWSFKITNTSCQLCIDTGMVQETISYYVNNESNVYGLLLNDSKAFDLVNYLFRTFLICILSKS